MSVAQGARTYAELPIALIDDPALPSRSEMDDAKLDELTESIRANGLLQPIGVARVGERYEVIYGHRRRIACTRAGLDTVPCFVYAEKTDASLVAQAHENTRREELNPADEGLWFAELLDKTCGGDIDKLAGMVGESVTYIDNRLALVRGDARVFDALRAGLIRIGVAHELNKCDDEKIRNYFLECAVRGGATVGTVTGWVLDWKRTQGAASPQAPAPEPAPTGIAAAAHDPFTCYVCGRGDNVHLIRQINVHVHCQMAILDPLLSNARGENS